MTTKEMIDEIIFLPKRFYDEGDISIKTLLKETGYFDRFEEVTENNI
jgi:hypothetical protein